MSKNIAIATALFVLASLSSTNHAVLAQLNPYGLPNNPYRLGVVEVGGLIDATDPSGITHTLVLPVGYVSGMFYDPFLPSYPNSWPTSHITHANNLISHWAGASVEPPGTYLHPVVGTTVRGNTADAANRLWDSAYSIWGYDKCVMNASIDASQNCHGYSTGKNTWINEMETLLNDDYEHTYIRDNLVPGVIFFNKNPIPLVVRIKGVSTQIGTVTGHSNKVENVHQLPGTHDLTIRVVEKNNVSALYEKTFTMQALCSNPNIAPPTHTGPCYMASAPLPWFPQGFYKKKP